MCILVHTTVCSYEYGVALASYSSCLSDLLCLELYLVDYEARLA
jgi:hypothetical protein